MRSVIILLLCAADLFGSHLKAGSARVDITPTSPVWMSGYAARTHPSSGVLVPLWAKALALESSGNRHIVIVTVDVVGIPTTSTVTMKSPRACGSSLASSAPNSS